MVCLISDNNQPCIFLRANNSSSWAANLCLFMIVAAILLAISLSFAMVGAWLLLPITSLQLAGLFYLLYGSSRSCQQCQKLSFKDRELVIEQGRKKPEQCWHCPRCDTRLSITRQPHPWDPIKIALCNSQQTIELGEFLNAKDCDRLLELLQQQGLRVCNDSIEAYREF